MPKTRFRLNKVTGFSELIHRKAAQIQPEAHARLASLPSNNCIYVISTTGGHRHMGNFSHLKNKPIDESDVAECDFKIFGGR